MNIGFVAVSGIRVYDPELLALGMTLPGFAGRAKALAGMPSLGLLTLAGMTPMPYTVAYMESADLELAALPAGYDLVAISTLTAQAPEAYALAAGFRALGTRVVLGGLHATVLPDEAAAHADAVVIGEGEAVWPAVLADAARGALRPRYDARALPYDLGESPMPAYHLLAPDRYNRITVQTSRGCPHLCEFCASSILLTPRYKQKPVARVLAELDAICARFDRPFIEFADDNGIVRRSWWQEFLPELAKRRLRWFTETDLMVADEPELLALMRAAGCVEVLIGLESPVAAGLAGLELRADWKLKHWDRARDAIRRIQAAGIRVNACFIVGLDGQDASIFEALPAFVEEAQPFDVQLTVPTPFPGTPFYDRLKRDGRILHDGDWARWTLFDINFVPERMSPAELRAGLIRAGSRIFTADAVAARHAGFRRHWLAGVRSRA